MSYITADKKPLEPFNLGLERANREKKRVELQCVDLQFRGMSLADSLYVNILIDSVAVLVLAALSYATALQARDVLGVSFSEIGPLLTRDTLWINVFTPLVVIISLSLAWGHYSRMKTFWAEALDILKAVAYSSAFVFAYSFFLKAHSSRIWMVTSLVMLIVGVPLARYVSRTFLKRVGLWDLPVILAGTPNQIRLVENAITGEKSISSSVAAKVIVPESAEKSDINMLSGEMQVYCDDMLEKYKNARILLAFSDLSVLNELPGFMRYLSKKSNKTIVASNLWGLPQASVEVYSPPSSEMVFLNLSGSFGKPIMRTVKRFFDFFATSFLFLLLLPVMLILCCLVALDGGKPIYRSKRIGFGGVEFDCFKFRSMRLDSDNILQNHLKSNSAAKTEWESSFKLKQDPRITRTGAFLRKTSLDELPQLLNVIFGDMSLVGPRPLLLEERTAYGPDFDEYTETKPGITGLWQVSGRSNTSYEKRIELNRWYQRNWSFWLDIVILMKTIPALLPNKDAC